jgi:Uma2 family endonuclease
MNPATLEQPQTYEGERGKPTPSRNHSAAQFNLSVELAKNREFRFYSEFTLEFDGVLYTPDLCVYPRQAVDWRHDEIRRSTAPLTAVEIFSPTQAPQTIMEKIDVYFQNGVKSCWLISPHLKTITIIGADGEEHVFHSGTVRDPYTGLTADVSAVFS